MFIGDRICPKCLEESLVEKGSSKWICINSDCREEFDEKFLDDAD
ncbi:hypothetical protein QU593_10045 [Rossellomorea marisflavi]|nr:hypothetical protein [Rossellomorea marisflavi]WJV20745.1 hypothetical protein QU593_10045 [Rossellomorea marisflavi]